MSFILEMKHITRFLCTRCWATIHLDPVEFATYTVAGGALGVVVVAGIALAGHLRFTDVGCARGSSRPWYDRASVRRSPLNGKR
jgi:hypothetical protein